MISVAVETAQRELIAAGLAFDEADFRGCTEEEIQSIEDRFRIHLPTSYRDFLRVMGHDAGDFLVGSDYVFPKMLGFRGGAEELLRKSGSGFTLPPTAFVFFSHQGYTYEWFDCNDREADPPVILFTELEGEPRKVSESFSAWLLGAVDDDIAANRELRRAK
jgi:hypothetical protein